MHIERANDSVRSLKWAGILIVSVVLLLPVVGCDSGSPEPARRVKKKKVAAAFVSVDEILAKDKEMESREKRYSYNSIGKRDPYRSFINREVVGAGGPSEELGPLQLHEIDQYHLRGIVWASDSPLAMVEAPDGIGHVVALGTLIGKNWGKVTQIKPVEIVITEEYRDPIENELIINEITMRLPEAHMVK